MRKTSFLLLLCLISLTSFSQNSDITHYDKKLTYLKKHTLAYQFSEDQRAKLTNVEKILYGTKIETSKSEKYFKNDLLVQKDIEVLSDNNYRNNNGKNGSNDNYWLKSTKKITLTPNGIEQRDKNNNRMAEKPISIKEIFTKEHKFKEPLFFSNDFVNALYKADKNDYVKIDGDQIRIEAKNKILKIYPNQNKYSQEKYDDSGRIIKKTTIAYEVLANGEYVTKLRENTAYKTTLNGACYKAIDRMEYSNIKLIYNGKSKLSSINEREFIVTPNPATKYISFNEITNISDIEIYTINGILVKQLSSSNISNIKINIADLKSGSYIIKMKNDFKTLTNKFIKI